MTHWTGDQPVSRPIPTQYNTNTEETQTSMPGMKFEPTIPVFERANTFPTPDHSAAVVVYFSFSRIGTGSFGANASVSSYKSVATFRWMAGLREFAGCVAQ
jgi:hypothetical protein